MNKILIASPVRNREWILPLYLKHLYNIDYDKKLINMYFILNNTTDNSYTILNNFKRKHINEYNNIEIAIKNKPNLPEDSRKTLIRNDYTYYWLSELRNNMLDSCVELKCDYLLSCDTDILVPSNIINELIIDKKSVCASLIFNGYEFKPQNTESGYDSVLNAYKYPNILNLENGENYKHIVNYHVKNPNKCKKDKIIEVDATGAVSLIPYEVCKNTKYAYDKQGEDIYWSKECKSKGYKLLCKPAVYSQHIMSRNVLQLYLDGKLHFSDGEIIQIK